MHILKKKKIMWFLYHTKIAFFPLSYVTIGLKPSFDNISFCNHYYYFNLRISRILQSVIADSGIFVFKISWSCIELQLLKLALNTNQSIKQSMYWVTLTTRLVWLHKFDFANFYFFMICNIIFIISTFFSVMPINYYLVM